MLRVTLLGEQLVHDDATGVVRARSSRTTALVGYLACHTGRPQSRQLIAGLFWPDSTDAQALTNLRRELHHLRELLGDIEALKVTASDLTWCDDALCVVDVRTLQLAREQALDAAERREPADAAARAAEGIAAYGGSFLPGVYDDWADRLREELRLTCLELCDLVAEVGPRNRSVRNRMEAARKRIAVAPLEEVGYRELMTLQADMGDRGGAINTYHHCAAILERELGVDPDPATRAALDRLMGRKPALTKRTTVIDDQQPVRAVQPGAGRVPLVGRDAERDRLARLWTYAVAGTPVVAVVRGPAGVGKTEMLDDLVTRAESAGAQVAAARCVDSFGRLALAPVADWLRTPHMRNLTQVLDPVWREEVHRLVPDTQAPVGPGGAGDRAMVDAWQQHRFHEGLARAFLNADRPLLLVLDDIQWCDPETLTWLAFLLGLARGRPLMLAASLREDHSVEAVLSRVRPLRSVARVEEIQLAPLDQRETAALVEVLTDRPPGAEEAALLHAATGGFPLYVVEATRAGALTATVSPGGELDVVLRRRIGQGSASAQEVAGLVAAFGREVTLDLLSEASDADADTVAQAVDELWQDRILREVGAGYDFSHDLLRVAAYAEVSPARRWLLHRRLAQALELSTAQGGEPVPGQLAEQYERGGRPDRALPAYEQAAEIAACRFAFAEAVRLHRCALRMVEALPAGSRRDRHELDCLLAMAAPLNALEGYASSELQAVLERAVEVARVIGSDAMVVTGLIGLWASMFVRGAIRDAYQTLAPALFRPGLNEQLLGEAYFALGGSASSLGRHQEALVHFERAHQRVEGSESLAVGTRPEVHALAWAAHTHWLVGQNEVAAERAAEAVGRARSFDHPYSLAVALAYACITHHMREDRVALRAAVEELDRLCRRHGFAYYREWALILGGWLEGGERGVARIREGIANLRRERSLARMPYWLWLLADTLEGTGQTGAVQATLDAARVSAEATGDAWWLPEILRTQARLAGDDALLGQAADLARSQGSVALLARCEADRVAPP